MTRRTHLRLVPAPPVQPHQPSPERPPACDTGRVDHTRARGLAHPDPATRLAAWRNIARTHISADMCARLARAESLGRGEFGEALDRRGYPAQQPVHGKRWRHGISVREGNGDE